MKFWLPILISLATLGGCVSRCKPNVTHEVHTNKRYLKDPIVKIWIDEIDYYQKCEEGTCIVPYSKHEYTYRITSYRRAGDMDAIIGTTCKRYQKIAEKTGSSHKFYVTYDEEFESDPYKCPLELKTVDFDDEKHAQATIEREHPSLTLPFTDKCNFKTFARTGISRCHNLVGNYGSLRFIEPVECFYLLHGKATKCDKLFERIEDDRKYWVYRMPSDLIQVRFRAKADHSNKAVFTFDPFEESLYRGL